MHEAVRALAERQYGVISREQALASGLSRSAIGWRLSTGAWARICGSVYRVAGAPPSWSQRAVVALLVGGPESALSHRTAGFLHGLDGIPREPWRIDVTVPRGRRVSAPGVTVHSAAGPFLRVGVGRLRATSLAKTLVDLSADLEPLALEVALDSAQRRCPGVSERLTRLLERRARVAPGVGVLKGLLALRLDCATDSPLEVQVRRALRRSGLARPALQHEVFDGRGDFVMRLDFAWPRHRVALHVDGYRWHHQRERFERDARQRAQLAALGWLSVPVTSRSLQERGWLQALARALEAREPQGALALGSAVELRRSPVATENTISP